MALSGSRKVKREDITFASTQDIWKVQEGHISGLLYTLVGPEDIKMLPVTTVTTVAGTKNTENYAESKQGSLDNPKMGPLSNTTKCEECSRFDCDGHYGQLSITIQGQGEVYMVNPIFAKPAYYLASMLCSKCSRLLIEPKQLKEIPEIENSKGTSKLNKISKKIENAGENLVCPACGNERKDVYAQEKVISKGLFALSDSKKPFDNARFYNLLKNMDPEEAKYLGFRKSQPKDIFFKDLIVIPNRDRGQIVTPDGTSYENGFQKYYRDLIGFKNNVSTQGVEYVREKIFETIKKSEGIEKVESSNAPMIDSLKKIFQGKTGLGRTSNTVRTNLFARSVAGPANGLYFDEAGVPQIWNAILATPIQVNRKNIDLLRRVVNSGKADYIWKKNENRRRAIIDPSKENLEFGDLVGTHMKNGDYVLLGRQPTLHRQSMLVMKANLNPIYNTFRLPLPITPALNADFDGDESHCAVVHDYMAQAEAFFMMTPQSAILSDATGKPTMGLVMNSLISGYILSDPNEILIPLNFFIEALDKYLTNRSYLPNFIERLNKYGVNLLSNRAYISLFFPEDFNYHHGDVLILDGIFIRGRLNKDTVGATNGSIINQLAKTHGSKGVRDFISTAVLMLINWLEEVHSVTIGVKDILNLKKDDSGHYYDENEKFIREELTKIMNAVDTLLYTPAKNDLTKNQLNTKITNELSVHGRIGGKLLKDNLAPGNNFEPLINSKAKGNEGNLGQIFGIIGQQTQYQQPLKQPLDPNRIHPNFSNGDNRPEAGGFIKNNFVTGVSPTELWFLAQSGREGVKNTSLKTADSGSLAHKMGKAAENISIAHDGSMRNYGNKLLSPSYNGGYDPSQMVILSNNGKDFRAPFDPKAIALDFLVDNGWVPEDTATPIKNSFVLEETDILKPPKSENDVTTIPYIKQGVKATKMIAKTRISVKSHFFPYLTQYEKAIVVGRRARQLSNGSDFLISEEEFKNVDNLKKDWFGDPDRTSYVDIAGEELRKNKLGDMFTVRRYPSNSRVINIHATEDNL